MGSKASERSERSYSWAKLKILDFCFFLDFLEFFALPNPGNFAKNLGFTDSLQLIKRLHAQDWLVGTVNPTLVPGDSDPCPPSMPEVTHKQEEAQAEVGT